MQSLNRVFLVVGLISTRSRINKRKDRSSINAGRKLMEEQQHKALLQGLKACETNYRYSISKHGNVSEHELSLWQKQLEDLSASQIMRNFKLHLQNSSFFPTVADIGMLQDCGMNPTARLQISGIPVRHCLNLNQRQSRRRQRHDSRN